MKKDMNWMKDQLVIAILDGGDWETEIENILEDGGFDAEDPNYEDLMTDLAIYGESVIESQL